MDIRTKALDPVVLKTHSIGLNLPIYKLIPSVDRISMIDNLSYCAMKGELSHKFFYWDVECSNNWIELEQSRDYPLAEQARQVLKVSYSNINDKVLEHIKSRMDNYDLINLGVGSGQDDVFMIKELMKSNYKGSKTSTFSYFPMDISYDLLIYTLNRINRDPSLNKDQLMIFILNGDLENLSIYRNIILNLSAKPKLFTLLGSTLSNYNEIAILSEVYKCMGENDFLLLGVDCIFDICNELRIKDIYSKSPVGLQFLLGPIRSMQSVGNPSLFPDALLKSSIDESYIKPRIASRMRSSLNNRKGVTTIVHSLDFGDGNLMELSIAHKYKTYAMSQFLEKMGFSEIAVYSPEMFSVGVTRYDECHYTLFLLEKSKERIDKQKETLIEIIRIEELCTEITKKAIELDNSEKWEIRDAAKEISNKVYTALLSREEGNEIIIDLGNILDGIPNTTDLRKIIEKYFNV